MHNSKALVGKAPASILAPSHKRSGPTEQDLQSADDSGASRGSDSGSRLMVLAYAAEAVEASRTAAPALPLHTGDSGRPKGRGDMAYVPGPWLAKRRRSGSVGYHPATGGVPRLSQEAPPGSHVKVSWPNRCDPQM